MTFRADLHCHSTCSDGSMTPTELVFLAKERGLLGLSITDHDTIAAYAEAIPVAKKEQLLLLPGVEFSTHLLDTSVHILGYAFSLESQELIDFCHKHAARRVARNREILQRLRKAGMPIEEEELVIHLGVPPTSVGRPHIAQAMVGKGYVGSVREAFVRYIGEGCACYAAGAHFTVEETMTAIKAAKGLVVIAHPHLIGKRSIITSLQEMPFDGIEVHYAGFPRHQTAQWEELAKKKGWIMTGGSDFHGSVKPTLQLGASWVGEETFKQLWDHYEANRKVV